jgi:hypothetical protein
MTFTETLLSEGYVFNDEDFDGCYVKHDPDECVFHCYQEGEDEGEWFYVKMTDGLFDVVAEYTVNVNNETVTIQ